MKKLLYLLVIIFLPEILSADELWNRAVSQYRSNSSWIAGTTEVVNEQFDRKGALKSIEHRTTRSQVVDGKIVSVILHAEKNGKDITDDEREKAEKERREREDDNGFPNPFDPDLQDIVTYEKNGAFLVVDGTRLIGYEFRMRGDEKTTYIGTAYLDPRTATPVEIEATMDPLPRFTEFVRLLVRFENDNDRWYATYMELEGAGGWFLIYRHFKSSITFSDHFRNDG